MKRKKRKTLRIRQGRQAFGKERVKTRTLEKHKGCATQKPFAIVSATRRGYQ